MDKLQNEEYKNWIEELKQKVFSSQIKASIAVNSALIEFYFLLGKSISEKESIWGEKLLEQTSKDLKIAFPEMKGFSERNLKYCRHFFQFYSSSISQQAADQFGQQAVAQLQNQGIP